MTKGPRRCAAKPRQRVGEAAGHETPPNTVQPRAVRRSRRPGRSQCSSIPSQRDYQTVERDFIGLADGQVAALGPNVSVHSSNVMSMRSVGLRDGL